MFIIKTFTRGCEPKHRPTPARFRPGARGSFFKILDCAVGLGMMAGPRRDFAIPHGP
jgi:hypothetical protein